MLNINNKEQCCACSACAAVCPQQCITLQADEEGFLYPHTDSERCVHCGLCEKVCPVLYPPHLKKEPVVYAACHDEAEIRKNSSSGALFTALAEWVLAQRGVVFGAGFDANWNVCHQYIETKEDLDLLRRSKYVQSNMGQIFHQVRQFAEQGRQILFVGTACQVAGLKNYLGKEYANLLTADLVCHAVPSPRVWRLFLEQTFPKGQIRAINFRDKKFGWENFYLSFTLPLGTFAHGPRLSVAEMGCGLLHRGHGAVLHNHFLQAFLNELINRPSCHACVCKGTCRAADFTLGDLWGGGGIRLSPEERKLGLSALFVNTEKAAALLPQLAHIQYTAVSVKDVTRANSAFYSSTRPHPNRAEFFARYQKEPLNQLIPRLLNKKPLPLRMASALLRKVRRFFPNKSKVE